MSRSRKATRADEGFVYFIYAENTHLVKIGTSTNPEKRFETLRTASPDRLRLLGVVPGGQRLERQMHQQWSEYRVRGEWFRLHPFLIDYLRRHRIEIPSLPVDTIERQMSRPLRALK